MKGHIGVGFLALAVSLAACKKAEVAKASPPPKVVVVAAQQKDEPIYREWIGTAEGDVNAEIRPKIDGYLLRRDYTEGSFVHEGQLLFEIDPRQFNAQMSHEALEDRRPRLSSHVASGGTGEAAVLHSWGTTCAELP